MQRVSMVLVAVATVSACVPSAMQSSLAENKGEKEKDNYTVLEAKGPDARTLDEAIKAAQATIVTPGPSQKIELGSPDHILFVDGLEHGYVNGYASRYSDHYLSYYKVFSLKVVPHLDYLLTVTSLCDCDGKTKSVVLPVGYLVDSEGKPVPKVLAYLQAEDKGRLVGTWGFKMEKAGTYYFILTADNADPGRKSGTVEAYVRSSSGVAPTMLPNGKMSGFGGGGFWKTVDVRATSSGSLSIQLSRR